VRGILIIILFNISLVAFAYIFFTYMNTLPEGQRNKIITVLCSTGAIFLVVSLLNLGVRKCLNLYVNILSKPFFSHTQDLSKQNPHFYYI